MSGAERWRTFLAVDPDEASRQAAADVAAALRRMPHGEAVQWVRPERMHVTLRFLGEIDPERVPGLAKAVAEEVAREPAFELALGPAGALPPVGRPRVLVLALEPPEPIVRLAAAVERAAVAAGFEAEARPFRPHLTLGRVRRGRRAPRPDDAPRPAPVPFRVGEVVLYHSRLGEQGPTYTPLERLALSGSTP